MFTCGRTAPTGRCRIGQYPCLGHRPLFHQQPGRPEDRTNSEASGLPWTSSVRGTVGLTISVVPDHSGDRTPKGASRSCRLVKRDATWICSAPSGPTTASRGTSVVEAGFGSYGTVPAGLAQHSSPDGDGVTSAGVHSLSSPSSA